VLQQSFDVQLAQVVAEAGFFGSLQLHLDLGAGQVEFLLAGSVIIRAAFCHSLLAFTPTIPPFD
jgi:hypothetical protein